MLYDLFICHASEDKEPFVRELAETLRDRHVEVWYDEFSLKIGDSLRRAIDRGLGSSRFGVIVLSKAFFAKEWPQYELDGLLQREIDARTTVLLPVWLDVSQSEVFQYSPSLAGRVAASTRRGVADVAAQILSVIRPQLSPLVVARDYLLDYDVTAPVVTDEYWLDVTEASNRLDSFGPSIPETAIWNRWAFPLPDLDGTAQARGVRLAWTALQLAWTRRADQLQISVTTPPHEVLEFIESSPGLKDTASAFRSLLVEYAPQLTIPGFGGDFETMFENDYQDSVRKIGATAETSPGWGSATTTNGRRPLCDGAWALRSPTFGNYGSTHIAEEYFHSGMFGSPVAMWDDADHLFWLLSRASEWVPAKLREILLGGLILCTRRWPWGKTAEFEWPGVGTLLEQLLEQCPQSLTVALKRDILGRANLARQRLHLPEEAQLLSDRFIGERILERCIEADREIAAARKARS
jgi:hypothetical protein